MTGDPTGERPRVPSAAPSATWPSPRSSAPSATGADGPPDTELLARARAGDPSGFAALVHRYAAVLHAAARSAGHDDADAAVVAALTRAMRRLDAAEADDLAAFLVGLLAPRGRRSEPLAVPDLDDVAPLPTADVDAIWAALAPRWPTGRRPVQVPRWVGAVALVIVLLVLSVAIPALLLVTADDEQGPAPLAEVVAEPLEEDDLPVTTPDR